MALLVLENDALTGSFISLTFSILFVTLRMANPMMFSFSSILMNTSSPTSLKKPFLGLPSATSSRSPSGSNQTVKVSSSILSRLSSPYL